MYEKGAKGKMLEAGMEETPAYEKWVQYPGTHKRHSEAVFHWVHFSEMRPETAHVLWDSREQMKGQKMKIMDQSLCFLKNDLRSFKAVQH